MRVLVIGGTGHIGTYLSPQLVEAGHTVVCVFALQIYNWGDLGVTPMTERRGCVGSYRPHSGPPSNAARDIRTMGPIQLGPLDAFE